METRGLGEEERRRQGDEEIGRLWDDGNTERLSREETWMDFTIKKYRQLLLALRQGGYEFVPFRDYIDSPQPTFVPALVLENSQTDRMHAARGTDSDAAPDRTFPGAQRKRIILRHDVDRLPENSLRLAQLEHDLGIRGSYYLRIVPESYDRKIMSEIAELGHEIGYHYEDVDLVIHNSKFKIQNPAEGGLIDLAYQSFRRNLEFLRKAFDIKTACMHGSPRSKYDNRIIWQKYSYRELGIIGEPYFDIDFDRVAYFTDTGRRWNGEKVSVRDKVHSFYDFDFRTTGQLISNIGALPNEVMFTIHPQRWSNDLLPWAKELVWQKVKNMGKRILVANSRA